MKVCEQFSTLQGEGKYLGVPSYFIRTTGCNLRCAWKDETGLVTKCDTPYTSWNPEKGIDLDVDSVLKFLEGTAIRDVVITGGEPTMQKDLPEIAKRFMDEQYRVTIETNGTIFHPGMERAFISASPKLQDSYAQDKGSLEAKLHINNNQFYGPLSQWMKAGNYQIKFVYNGKTSEREIKMLQRHLAIPTSAIYIMPQGISTEQFNLVQKQAFQFCVDNGYTYTPRMHVDIFGNKRGI